MLSGLNVSSKVLFNISSPDAVGINHMLIEKLPSTLGK